MKEKEIKVFEGKMVRLKYTIKRNATTFNADITAKLVAVTKFNAIFDVNGNEPEIILKHAQITGITSIHDKKA
jgi:hypothetical protein